jgi:hypothetical protein
MMEESILLLQNFITYTKRYKRVGSIPAFYSGVPVFKYQPAKLAIFTGNLVFFNLSKKLLGQYLNSI